jgi:hypothetical protein
VSDRLDHIYSLFGDAVLLSIPLGEKKPATPEWQTITLQQSRSPQYARTLEATIKRGGNLGVRQGDLSGHLVAIDIDEDSLIESFLDLNPQLMDFTRTRGARGCQIHFRMTSPFYPHETKFLKLESGVKWGEWRGGTGQSIIWGRHPTGVRYHFTVEQPITALKFSDIRWPAGLILPWVPAAKQQKAAPESAQSFPPINGAALENRISAYLAKIPGAISGDGGHTQTLKATLALVNGFALSADEAYQWLLAYNERCEPAWSEKELQHKASEAEKIEDKSSKGYLLHESAPPAPASSNGHSMDRADFRDKDQGIEFPQAGDNGKDAGRNGEQKPIGKNRPLLILPNAEVEYRSYAKHLFPVLAESKRFFTRSNAPVELVAGKNGKVLQELTATTFRSRLEDFFDLQITRQLGHGETVLKPSRCSHDQAEVLLNTSTAQELLPSISIMAESPIFTEIEGKIVPLQKGYHDVLGGVLVMRDREIQLIPLNDAVSSLLALLDDFAFVSPSDRSRAVASLDIQSGLKPSKRGLISDCFFNFLQDFQAILYHKLHCLLGEVVHLFSADPEECLPAELVDTLQPRLFSFKEVKAGSLFRSQKLIQQKGGAAGVAKIPARVAIGDWYQDLLPAFLASPRICKMSIATIAPTVAVLAASSYGGDTSTTSPPIALTPFKCHRISRCNADVSPPGAGVPVPPVYAGSIASTSSVI